ncbi:MAG: hypothetical protein HN370_06765 [Phycisphaerales bacterium]|nr:hypothetical protein [Phycisphaerales bacterium]
MTRLILALSFTLLLVGCRDQGGISLSTKNSAKAYIPIEKMGLVLKQELVESQKRFFLGLPNAEDFLTSYSQQATSKDNTVFYGIYFPDLAPSVLLVRVKDKLYFETPRDENIPFVFEWKLQLISDTVDDYHIQKEWKLKLTLNFYNANFTSSTLPGPNNCPGYGRLEDPEVLIPEPSPHQNGAGE